VRQVDVHGRYTAGAGSAIYTARSFPKTYWNRFQFVAEPTGHLLGQFFLEAHGTDFIARNARNFAASDDEWTAPVCAEVGPDGALWVIDWYNYIVQHNPTPRGFETGKGSAYETPLRDKTHGRVYRIASRTGKSELPQSLDRATPQQLVAALRNDNMLWRMHAQRLLIERGQRDVVPAICEILQDKGLDAIGLNTAAIHALWTLNGLGMFNGREPAPANVSEALAAGLVHPSAAVRRAAVMVAPRSAISLQALLNGHLLTDADAQVRLAALLAISEMPASETAGSAAFAALQEPRNARDRWIPDGIVAAGAPHDAGFLKAAMTGSPSGEVGKAVRLVAAHYAQRGPADSIVSTLSAVQTASPAVATAVLDGLVAGWPQGKSLVLGNGEKEKLSVLMQTLPQEARDRLLALAQRWGQEELFGTSVGTIIASLKKQVTDGSATDNERVAVAKRLVALEDRPDVWKLVLDQVTLLTPPDLAVGLVNALGESRDGRISDSTTRPIASGRALRSRTSPLATEVVDRWQQFTPTVRRAAVVLLMRRPEWAATLLLEIENRTINRTDLASELWAQLKQHPDRSVSRRAERLTERGALNTTGREEIVARFLPLANEKGDAVRGRSVFTTNCAVCHTFNGEGKTVGPDLTGIGARARSEILADILDPNRSVEANYRAWIVSTKDNETYTGRLESETQTTVEILDANAQKHVLQRKDIASMQASQLSIMPNGFETLLPDDLKGLLEYLTQGRQERASQ
jgi:putative heme-binding domain-containing protein